jgi:1-phosphofructokinase
MSNPSLVVFAPSPLLTITVEAPGTEQQEIHLHAGGQGFWVARMASLLGARVTLCSALGGESGDVLRGLIAKEHVQLLAVGASAPNGVYIHARRAGVREEFARTSCSGLTRHEADELYGAGLAAALDARIAMLTGFDPPDILEPDIYRRLAADLRSNGVTVIADLSGSQLQAALAGGVDVLKISDEELGSLGLSPGASEHELLEALGRLRELGARAVLISRRELPALALDASGRFLKLSGPHVEPLEPRGAGDSMFAALGTSIAAGGELEDALRLAMAAGCLNATRHGLGTGRRQEIEHLSRHIEITQLGVLEQDRVADAR